MLPHASWENGRERGNAGIGDHRRTFRGLSRHLSDLTRRGSIRTHHPRARRLRLDGGQIDGEAKITIAQRVIGDLLDTLPADREIGLTLYGHRRKGDCGDIELAVPAGPDTRDAIRAAVNAVKPKGKTPLSAAVIDAAKALRFEEEAATVILVSDGRETCDLDPCAVGRDLESAGIGFTTHVIGFDVTDPADKAQLQCLAENTGGRFLSASDAGELTEALEAVSAPLPAPEPPATVDVTFLATDGEDGPPIRTGLTWTLTDLDTGAPRISDFKTPDLRMALTPGRYRADVLRVGDGQTATLETAISAGEAREIVLALASTTPDATVTAPAKAVAGSTILVDWSGPDEDRDYISVAAPETPGGNYVNYTYAKDGTPLKLIMPPEPGSYQVRYIRNDGQEILATSDLQVTPVDATLTAPGTATAGATVVVAWTGPDYDLDYISVATPDAPGGNYVNYTYARDGAPLKLIMPPEPGAYVIRYVMNQGATVLAEQPVEISAAGATLSAPAEAVAGSTILVDWTGPDEDRDYISVAIPDAPGGNYVNYTYTKDGAPLELVMPPEPGAYVIRYVMNQGGTILSEQPVTVSAATATLEAPAEAVAGSTILVDWTGPDEDRDYISVAEPDAPGGNYVNYTYANEGAPLKLIMPPEPGTYVIRYVMNQGGTVLASAEVAVSEATADITAPATSEPGAGLIVEWTGPDYDRDYIAIAEPDGRGSDYISYVYANDGSPTRIEAPDTPGDYEIRYIMNQGGRILATTPLRVD